MNLDIDIDIYKFGEPFILRLPKSFVEQNELTDGSILKLKLEDNFYKLKLSFPDGEQKDKNDESIIDPDDLEYDFFFVTIVPDD